MTTAETTQEMAPPETLVEPDRLLSEIANGQQPPLYEALVAELGDPHLLVAELDKQEQALAGTIAGFAQWRKDASADFRVWLHTMDDGDDSAQHRAEETTTE